MPDPHTPEREAERAAVVALAERCEQAMGADRLLDAEIVVALNIRPDWLRKSVGELWVDTKSGLTDPPVRFKDHRMKRRSTGDAPIGDYPSFTASLDAAMTLVPDGWPSKCVGTTDDDQGYAALAGNDGHMMCEDPDEFYVEGNAATPALALCAAALRARAAHLPSEDTPE